MTRLYRLGLAALLLVIGATSAQAETLLMPKRDFAMGQSEVVWGITTLPVGTVYNIDFGDGSPDAVGSITATNRSYLAVLHSWETSGPFTITLTVGAEQTTVQVNVHNTALETAAQVRDLNIHRAIEDGLRALWVNQTARTTFDTTSQTTWSSDASITALTVLAFMNHSYSLPNDNSVPTGIYSKYAVQRGLNFVLASLSSFVVSANTPNGGNACEGIGAGTTPCTLFTTAYPAGYRSSIAILPFAGSNALSRMATVGVGNTMSYGEVAKRLVNGLAWGQNDGPTAPGRGGWDYSYNATLSDGSTIGWNMLALLDAAAAGVPIPAFVKTEFDSFAFTNAKNQDPDCVPDPSVAACDRNVDGTYDYSADGNPLAGGGGGTRNTAKVGIGLQAAFYVGDAVGDSFVNAAIAAADRRWSGVALPGDYTSTCSSVAGAPQNKGCAYAMFNLFKGLKLLGVTTLPNVNRPGTIVGDPDDWYADYVDWLINNQRAPQTADGGFWENSSGNNNRFNQARVPMGFTCCGPATDANASTAMAELILASVALIQPDPVTFADFGLRHGNPLTTNPDINPVNTPHTVVARVLSAGLSPVPGVTISFQITGRNGSTALASGVSDANGEVSRTYTDLGPAASGGIDNIRAFIGQIGSNLGSNTLIKNWILPTIECDVNADSFVDSADLLIIRNANRTIPTGADPRDANRDGRIDVTDYRYCSLRTTR